MQLIGKGVDLEVRETYESALLFGRKTLEGRVLDPTRAALIYLAEQIFAALYAYVAVGRTLSLIALFGAGLILAANVLVEVLERRGKRPTVAIPSVTP